ncbi:MULTISPECIES: DUF2938 domain-containing protein [Acinetobacter]|uniref:DUF2938 domain-containing protein n=1 Tax=Acinetobacter baylyi (strain ATCC 33305 / BD413 / ADP1) TaxID=62977 RepID=Q6F8H9_ACIAD|nr:MULTISPECIES: DUF2938 domain-containing protein [Acinetobacter]ENV53183.1 hypothetical protein F952_02628 [Acinetobacter baylyi DSM 14961 = CIP 107474]KAF2372177.1 hypothetical protein BSL88_04765 [Acinetobacter baylyi]KAF2372500.1 hypothetical protein BSL67_13575 [Acinetobacter baylyi]KAF2376907.1 hypothetical protein BSN81_10750 [Acinetobacter baylyi]KAF2379790.1 hypothetical protein BSN83_13795 [Acinetobacter baylyi]
MKALEVIFVGCGATLFMDAYSFILKIYFGVQSLDYRVIGRWLIYLSKAKFIHHTIMQTPEVKYEKVFGWLSHYLIGILFSAIFFQYTINHPSPTLLSALTFGLVTVVIPFLIIQPCLGFGLAASKMPLVWIARFKSIGHHLIFGLGLYLSFQIYHYVWLS